MKSPCGKNCPDRTPDCHSTCERWAQYEKERNKEYAYRKERWEIASYHRDVFVKQKRKEFSKRRK